MNKSFEKAKRKVELAISGLERRGTLRSAINSPSLVPSPSVPVRPKISSGNLSSSSLDTNPSEADTFHSLPTEAGETSGLSDPGLSAAEEQSESDSDSEATGAPSPPPPPLPPSGISSGCVNVPLVSAVNQLSPTMGDDDKGDASYNAIPKFSGRKGDEPTVEAFLRMIEAVGRTRKWSADTQLTNLKIKLTGPAAKLAWDSEEGATNDTYDKFKAMLLERYRVKDNIELHKSFATIYQLKDECVEDYASRLKTLSSKFQPKVEPLTTAEEQTASNAALKAYADHSMCFLFLSGLRDSLKAQVLNKPHATLEEAIKSAKEVQENEVLLHKSTTVNQATDSKLTPHILDMVAKLQDVVDAVTTSATNSIKAMKESMQPSVLPVAGSTQERTAHQSAQMHGSAPPFYPRDSTVPPNAQQCEYCKKPGHLHYFCRKFLHDVAQVEKNKQQKAANAPADGGGLAPNQILPFIRDAIGLGQQTSAAQPRPFAGRGRTGFGSYARPYRSREENVCAGCHGRGHYRSECPSFRPQQPKNELAAPTNK